MSPPSYGCNVPVIPTFISTDLITPGHENRETLPAIGLHTRDLQRPKLWGHETKPIAYGELAYSCFKPSHLCTDHMIVTHRHHGNRISYIEPKEQPYHITSLQLSKCRMNDQLMPPPLESNLPQKHFVEEPWPYDLRNNYFSHRCKFQLFPTNGVDLRDAAVPQDKQLIRGAIDLSPRTKGALADIHNQLYKTTTYQKNFPMNTNIRKRRYFNQPPNQVNLKSTKTYRLLDRPQVEHGLQQSENRTSTWPSWPLGEHNITNNPPGYPKIKLPKYSYDTALSRNKLYICSCDQEETLRKCKTDVNNSTKYHGFNEPSTLQMIRRCCENTNTQLEEQRMPENSPKCCCLRDLNNAICSNCIHENCLDCSYEANQEDKTTLNENSTEAESVIDNTENAANSASGNQEMTEKPTLKARDACCLDINKRLYDVIISKAKPRFDYKYGFKTEAHRRFHKAYPDKLPDLRDADTEGRRHHYCGINGHLFRG